MVCKRFCNELVNWAKKRSWESWSSALSSLHKWMLSLCIQCLLSYWVLGHTPGLRRCRRTHCPFEASVGNPPSATVQELRAGNYETAVASAPASVFTPVLSVSIFMPGIWQEFAFCKLKRKKNEKDKGKRLFCEREKREKMKGFLII